MRLIALLAAVAVIAISPAQAESNSRFDGTWIGKEIVTQRSDFKSPGTRNTEATIIITQGGTLVGIIGGFCPGRFNSVSPKGNSLNLKANDCSLTLRVSPDGKTLIENGVAERHVSTPGARHSMARPTVTRSREHFIASDSDRRTEIGDRNAAIYNLRTPIFDSLIFRGEAAVRPV